MPTITFTVEGPGDGTGTLRFRARENYTNSDGEIVTTRDSLRIVAYTTNVQTSVVLPTGPWKVSGLATKVPVPFDVGASNANLKDLIVFPIPANAPATTLSQAVTAWMDTNVNTEVTEPLVEGILANPASGARAVLNETYAPKPGGTPTGAKFLGDDNTWKVAATPAQITTAINDLVNAAPGTLNTLDELAQALGDDANFAATTAAAIGAKYTKPGSGVPWGDLADTVLASLWRNVKFYGAVGNGTANDTTAIQNAINACAPGETILFPPGTYRITAALNIKSGVSLRGSSIGTDAGTIIKADAAFTGAMLQSAVLASGSKTLCDDPMSIRGLTLDGNKAVLTSATFDGIALCAYWARIQGVYIRNTPRHAIRLTDQRNDAVNVTNSCSENRVVDCKIANIGGNGIHQESNNGNSNLDGFCENNLLSDIAGSAIQFAKSAGWSFKRNHAYGIGVNGIDLSGCFATSVVENYVEDCGGANLAAQFYVGIRIQQLDGWASQVIGNHVRVPAKGTATQRTGYRLLTGGGQTTAVIAFIGNTAAGSGGAGCVPAQYSGISAGILTLADRGNHFRGFDSNVAVVDSGVVSVGDIAQAAALAAKADLTGGKVPTAQLGSGTANTSTYLRGDQTWQPITAGEADTAGSEIDYAESAITETLGTSAADIPGLALTFATGDNPAMVEFYPAGFFGNNTGTITYQIIRTSDSAVLAMGVANVTTTVGFDFPAAISKRIPAGTASDTYKAQAWRSAGSATCTINPGAKTMYLQAKAL